MCTAVVGGSIQRAATSISAASDQRSTMPTMRNRIRDRRNPVRSGVLGCASGISVTFQNNARGITGLAQVAATQVSDGRVAHSIAHFAIEWGHDAADASQTKAALPSRTFA